MTLIIAGHHIERGYFGDSSYYEDGLFAVADSNITSNGRVLVSGFKKVIEMPIRVKGLNFLSEYFNGYFGTKYESTCFVAFAGSTLVAQHILNSIKNHLNELLPTHNGQHYEIAMICEGHKHLRNIDYPDHMFLDQHIMGLLSGEFISNVVLHAIQAVLEQAKKHGSMQGVFSAYQAEFILGVQCLVSKNYELYEYRILPDDSSGAKAEKTKIPQGQVAVIGRREAFFTQAQDVYSHAISGAQCTSKVLHQFLANAIDDQNSIGINAIGKPCGLYRFRGGVLVLDSQIW